MEKYFYDVKNQVGFYCGLNFLSIILVSIQKYKYRKAKYGS